MGIQINGSTDTISAVDGSLSLEGGELRTVSGLNVTGVVTATSYKVGAGVTVDASGIHVVGVVTATSYKVGTGVTVDASGIHVAGVVTATSFSGDGSSLTGIAATDNVRTGILDVAGVGTFRSDVNISDSIIHLGDTNTKIRFPAADTITFETGGSERARIDSSGNFGVGTASPASDALLTLQGTNRNIFFLSDGAPTDCAIDCSGGRFVFRGGGSGTTVGSIPEQMRLDENNRLLLGTTTDTNNIRLNQKFSVVREGSYGGASFVTYGGTAADSAAHFDIKRSRGSTDGTMTSVADDDLLGSFQFLGADGTNFVRAAQINCHVDGTPGTNDMPARLVFGTTADGASSPTERMRITRKGCSFFSNDSGTYYGNQSSEFFSFDQITNQWVLGVRNNHASQPFGMVIKYANASPNSSAYEFLYLADSTALRFEVRSNGGVANYSSNDANLCDEREKKNIEALDSTWGCLKNWDLKKFHYNEDADTDDKRYGVIAQQVAPHCPEVITDWVKQKAEDAVLDDDGNVVTPAKEEIVRMGVKEQQMMWMAIKALQEAQTRIETLETANASQAATIAALDARLTALEGGN